MFFNDIDCVSVENIAIDVNIPSKILIYFIYYELFINSLHVPTTIDHKLMIKINLNKHKQF